mmetsp:Transcript_81760/g.132574  ORF Transcript_81760/g.132574 Transcript_81760/m.132574 type:complete len:229 (-) Transcript_81760:137-823(-)
MRARIWPLLCSCCGCVISPPASPKNLSAWSSNVRSFRLAFLMTTFHGLPSGLGQFVEPTACSCPCVAAWSKGLRILGLGLAAGEPMGDSCGTGELARSRAKPLSLDPFRCCACPRVQNLLTSPASGELTATGAALNTDVSPFSLLWLPAHLTPSPCNRLPSLCQPVFQSSPSPTGTSEGSLPSLTSAPRGLSWASVAFARCGDWYTAFAWGLQPIKRTSCGPRLFPRM